MKTCRHITGFHLAKIIKPILFWKSFHSELFFRRLLYSKFSGTECSSSSSVIPLSCSVYISLLWPWSWARHSWNTGLQLVCHSVVWMYPFSLSALFPCFFIHSHCFPSAWPEFSWRVTQRLGNTHSKVSVHDFTQPNYRTSTVSPPWEPRPPRNQNSSQQSPKIWLSLPLASEEEGKERTGEL